MDDGGLGHQGLVGLGLAAEHDDGGPLASCLFDHRVPGRVVGCPPDRRPSRGLNRVEHGHELGRALTAPVEVGLEGRSLVGAEHGQHSVLARTLSTGPLSGHAEEAVERDKEDGRSEHNLAG